MFHLYKKTTVVNVIVLDSIGTVRFIKQRQSKALRLKIKAFEEITVTMPHSTSLKFAVQFVYNQSEWIHKQQKKSVELEYTCRELNKAYPLPSLDEAIAKIKERIDYFSHKHSISYERLAIRNQKTRWGSCSSKNNINLNINLARLPQHLMDYVILHELAHIKHKNHSAQFKKHLDKLLNNLSRKELEKGLKDFGLLLIKT